MRIANCVQILSFFFVAQVPVAPSWAQQSDAAKIYSQYSKSVLLIFVKAPDSKIVAQGTGFLVAGGKIITNKHVIVDGSPLIDLGGVRIPATVESTDDLNDLAVLSVAAEISAEPLVLAEKTPPPGSNVFAIGNPQGLEKSISTGVLSGVRTVGKRELLQITTPVSHGSSGGPVFDSSGKVVGVTVSSIEGGQNLNFAVPALAVVELLRGKSHVLADPSTILELAKSLVQKRSALQYSEEADSPYQKNQRETISTLSAVIERAGKDDVPALLQLSDQLTDFNPSDREVAVLAAERAIRLTPSPDASLALAKALNYKASFLATDAEQKKALIDRAERSARQAISQAIALKRQPSAEMYFWLGDTLEMRDAHQDADTALRRALDLNHATPDADQEARILRDLITTAEGLKRPAEIDKWFAALVHAGTAEVWDWQSQARRLDAAARYADAATTWQGAAGFKVFWTDWCEAAGSFALAGGREDAVLSAARNCISEGSGKPKSEKQLAEAHRNLANVLNERGVYEEALSHAKESTVLAPESAWAYDAQAEALIGLRRFQEAINASKQAIRLSDGKFGMMHFHLGYAYFEVENWQFAKQSFEKAAELVPEDDVAASNVALCLQRMGLFIDAARWYEEALRRNPKRSDRQELVNRIAALRAR